MAATAALLTLGLGEIGLRLGAPLPDPYERLKWREEAVHPRCVASQLDPHLEVTFRAEPALPGMQDRTSFSTNNAGFRGEELRLPKPHPPADPRRDRAHGRARASRAHERHPAEDPPQPDRAADRRAPPRNPSRSSTTTSISTSRARAGRGRGWPR